MTPSVRTFLIPLIAIIGPVAFVSESAAQYHGRSHQTQRNIQNQARMNQAQRAAGVAGVRPAAGGVAARPAATGASLRGMQTALNAFAMDMGRMPTTAEGLNALIQPPPGARNWRGPYISTNNWQAPFTDLWGSQYRYVVQGTGRQAVHYIISNGPDRAPGTRDDLSVQF